MHYGALASRDKVGLHYGTPQVFAFRLSPFPPVVENVRTFRPIQTIPNRS